MNSKPNHPSPFYIDNSEHLNKPQNKLAVLIGSRMVDEQKIWTLTILDPVNPEKLNGGIEFSYDSRFEVIQYYADYIRFLLGDKTISKPKPWDYDTEILTPKEGFDFTPYNGKTVIENQLPIHIRFYPLPESNGRSNWSVIPRSTAYHGHELLTFSRTEIYNKGLFYMHQLQYLLGEIENEPKAEDYDMTLYRNHKTGEFFTPTADSPSENYY